MKIEYSNWEPASEIYEFMGHFDENINTIKSALDEIPSFESNYRNDEISQHDINERKNHLIRVCMKVNATIDLLNALMDSYHNYQEMYFDTITVNVMKFTEKS